MSATGETLTGQPKLIMSPWYRLGGVKYKKTQAMIMTTKTWLEKCTVKEPRILNQVLNMTSWARQALHLWYKGQFRHCRYRAGQYAVAYSLVMRPHAQAWRWYKIKEQWSGLHTSRSTSVVLAAAFLGWCAMFAYIYIYIGWSITMRCSIRYSNWVFFFFLGGGGINRDL